MFTRSQARKLHQQCITNEHQKDDESIYSTTSFTTNNCDSDSSYVPSESSCNESDDEVEEYIEIACWKLHHVARWLKSKNNLDDKLDVLEKIDELFDTKEMISLTRITNDTLEIFQNPTKKY